MSLCVAAPGSDESHMASTELRTNNSEMYLLAFLFLTNKVNTNCFYISIWVRETPTKTTIVIFPEMSFKHNHVKWDKPSKPPFELNILFSKTKNRMSTL